MAFSLLLAPSIGAVTSVKLICKTRDESDKIVQPLELKQVKRTFYKDMEAQTYQMAEGTVDLSSEKEYDYEYAINGEDLKYFTDPTSHASVIYPGTQRKVYSRPGDPIGIHRGRLIHLSDMFQRVTQETNLSNVIKEVRRAKIPDICKTADGQKEVFYWINHTVTDQLSSSKILFLLAIIGLLLQYDTGHVGMSLEFGDDFKRDQIDLLLQAVPRIDISPSAIPSDVAKLLDVASTWLIKKVNGTLIHFFVYFSSLLSVSTILEKNEKLRKRIHDEVWNTLGNPFFERIRNCSESEMRDILVTLIDGCNTPEILRYFIQCFLSKSYKITIEKDIIVRILNTLEEVLPPSGRERIEAVYAFWRDGKVVQSEELAHGIRKTLIKTLEKEPWPYTPKELSDIIMQEGATESGRQFVTDNVLKVWHNSEFSVTVSCVLRAMTTNEVTNHFGSDVIETMIKYGLQELFQPLQPSKHRGREQKVNENTRRNCLNTNYSLLAIVRTLTSPQILSFYDEMVYTAIKDVPLDELVGNVVDSKSYLNEEAKICLADHINLRVSQETLTMKQIESMICRLKDRMFHYLLISNDTIQKLVLTILDTFDVSTLTLVKVVDNYILWLLLFGSQGALSKPVHAHKIVEHVSKMLRNLLISIRNKTLALDAPVWNIIEHKTQVKHLISLILESPGHTIGDHSKVSKYIDDQIRTKKSYLKERHQIAEFYDQTRHLLKKFLCKYYQDKIQDSLMNPNGNLIMNRERIDEHWGEDLQRILQLHNKLNKQLQSRIFINTCSATLDNHTTTSGISILDFCTTLESDCTTIFDVHCQEIISGDLKMDTSEVAILLQGIGIESLGEELRTIEQIFGKECQSRSVEALNCFVTREDLMQKAKLALGVFAYVSEEALTDANNVFMSFCSNKFTLDDWMDYIHPLRELELKLHNEPVPDSSESYWKIIEELSKLSTKSLMKFLKEIVNEDLRNLVDIVGNCCDMWMELMDVKQYLTPFLTKDYVNQLDTYESLLYVPPGQTFKNIPTLISSCVTNFQMLQELYRSMATRNNITLEVIGAAQKRGQFCFTWNETDRQCQMSLRYCKCEQGGDSYDECSEEELTDLRSRALLIISSGSKSRVSDSIFPDSEEQPDLQRFVESINSACAITDLYAKAKAAGFIDLDLKTYVPISDLQTVEHELLKELALWEDTLNEVRENSFYMNFFNGKELKLLEHFFRGETSVCEDVELLFHYVYPYFEVTPETVSAYETPSPNANLAVRLQRIAAALEAIFQKKSQNIRRISLKPATSKTVHTTVQPGEVFIAHLPDNKVHNALPVVMQLCLNTTGSYPEPSEILFCHKDTSIQDIDLLLRRCSHAATYELSRLYLIANVEQLSSETQLGFIDRLKDVQEERKKDLLLALVYRGTKTSYISRQFPSRLTHQPAGISVDDLRTCFADDFPHVEIVTSKCAGLGKTSYINQESQTYDSSLKTPASLLIGGTLKRKNIVKQLRKDIRNHPVLHFDVKEMENPDIFDVLIFELVVVGISATEECSCRCLCKKIFIEIANTLNDHLRKSLVVASLFRISCLEWKNFTNYVVSDDVNSAEQIVCRYKKALDEQTIDNNDITIDQGDALAEQECQRILRDIFKSQKSLSFAEAKNFVHILAGELRKVSLSTFFSTNTLEFAMQRKKSQLSIRSDLVRVFFNLAMEITLRLSSSSATSTSTNTSASFGIRGQRNLVTASDMENRYQGIAKWSKSKHLLTVFNRQDTETVTVLYRDVSIVSEPVRRLLKVQREELKDYNNLPQEELKRKLERVCKKHTDVYAQFETSSIQDRYVLTPDNMLKMTLMMAQIEARVPVILMGETGCGKTMLIKYLAELSEVSLNVLHIHAGTTEDEIERFVLSRVQHILQKDRIQRGREESTELEVESRVTEEDEQEIWLFFDELNTCDHLGLLTEIICHKNLKGILLPDSVVCIAACNPYCKRTKSSPDIGLQERMKESEKSQLVYRVNPLPETMLNYVWDFGWLQERDETAYIERMVEGVVSSELQLLFIQVLIKSQKFTRDSEGTRYCVSLRDIDRCKNLLQWMRDQFLKEKGIAKSANIQRVMLACDEIEFRAMILAISLCYHSRFVTEETRKAFRSEVASACQKSGRVLVSEKYIANVIRAEQNDLLDRMKLPPGTAKNEALRENVFVLIIAILTRLPVFVIGKPGSSKSLSMSLIEANFKGTESSDSFFKKLPAVFKLSFQGSKTSTSDGIIRVFENASKLRREGRQPVVLLDEVGLAEESDHNPLKVLHERLEPDDSGFPPVAMVGISNWAIDAAKMNRAIFLSRPDPTSEDLFTTAVAIRDGLKPEGNEIVNDDYLRKFSEAYYKYKQKCNKRNDRTLQRKNFHGLRDFYSMIKYLTRQTPRSGICDRAILRNFGGLPRSETSDVLNTLTAEAGIMMKPEARPTTVELIKDNLNDPTCRHLMLITKGYSTLTMLQEILQKRKHILLLGSSFENDFTDEYDHRMLSKIVLHMEMECTVVLWGLENIYGSLYDMLNQNYTNFGQKKFCRVALGPNCCISREVHPKFKCIVLIEENDVIKCDPPFLNRFEKQSVSFSDVISDTQKRMVENLDRWTVDISHTRGLQFTREEAFVGFHEGILPSVVLHNAYSMKSEINAMKACSSSLAKYHTSADEHSSDPESQSEAETIIFRRCIADLMGMACSDAVLRFSESHFLGDTSSRFKSVLSRVGVSVDNLQKEFFAIPLQKGLRFRMEDIFTSDQSTSKSFAGSKLTHQRDGEGLKLVVHTYSSFHADVEKCFQGADPCQIPLPIQVEKLSNIASERHLDDQLRYFWTVSDAKLLIIQCKPALDGNHMVMAKWLIELYRTEYQSCRRRHVIGAKHVCIVIHLDRGSTRHVKSHMWKCDFMNDWHIFTLETIKPHEFAKADLQVLSMSEAVSSCSLDDTIKEQLLWCFNCINYTTHQREVEELFHVIRVVAESKPFMSAFKESILWKIRAKSSLQSNDTWEIDVAFDRQLLIEYSTMAEARREVVRRNIRDPMAKIVYAIEKLFAWDSILAALDQPGSSEAVLFWIHCFKTARVFERKFTDLPPPMGVHCYVIDKLLLSLKFPFFMVFHEQILSHRDLVMDCKDSTFDDVRALNEARTQLADIIETKLPDLLKNDYLAHFFDDYLGDMCNVLSINYGTTADVSVRIALTRWLLEYYGTYMKDEGKEGNHEEGVLRSLATWYVVYWTVQKELPGQIKLVLAFLENDEFSLAMLQEDVMGSNVEEAHMTFRLVSSICQRILPTGQFVASCGGIVSWQKYARKVATKAMEVDDNPYQFLMICIEFQQILEFLPSSQEQYNPLENIAKEGRDGEGVIEKQEVFQEIQRSLTEIRSQRIMPEEETDNFLCCYIGRCLEASPETPLLHDFLSSLVTESGDLISGSRSVLYTIIGLEFDSVKDLSQVMSRWRNLICGHVTQSFQIIDDCLRLQRDIDCPLGVACCDVIREILEEFILTKHLVNMDLDEPVSKVLSIVNDATVCSLQLAAALAFVKAILKAFSGKFCEGVTTDLTKGTLSELTKYINRITAGVAEDQDGISEFSLFLIRCLRKRYQTHYNFVADCRDLLSPFIPCLQHVQCPTCIYQNRLGFNPMTYVQDYEVAELAFTNWKRNTDDEMVMEQLFVDASKDANKCLVLFAILIENGYLAQSLGGSSTDAKLQESLSKHIASFPDSVGELLKRLQGIPENNNQTCVKKLKPAWLQLSEASTPLHVAQASVVAHVSAVILSSSCSCDSNVFHRLLRKTGSRPIGELFIPASGRAFSVDVILRDCQLSSYDCSCRVTIFRKKQQNIISCPECKCACQQINWNEFPLEPKKKESLPGYKMDDKSNSDNRFLCIRKLSPVTYRVIRVLTNSVLLIACNINPSTLGSLMQICKASADEVHGQLTECIRKDWEVLENLLDLQYEAICLLLHSIIKESQDVLSEEYSAHEPEGRDLLEQHLAAIIDKQVRLLPGSIRRFRKCITKVYKCISNDVEDISLVDSTSRADSRLQKYFLSRKEPTVENFRACFISQGMTLIETHPFLALFFRWYKALEYVKYLPVLVHWNRRVSSFLCHRLNRKTAQNQTHGALFDKPQFESDAKKRGELKEAYLIFEEAWNEVRKGWDHLGGDSDEDIEAMTQGSPIELSLFCRSHKDSQLWRMINALQEVQNKFLYDVLTLKTDDSTVHLNLQTDDGIITIPRVLLNEVKDHDVIQFEVSDIPLVFHDLATTLRKGEHNRYDFAQIENKLAKDIVHHRAILQDPSEGALDNFIFADEFFHACSAILKDVKEKIAQEIIPKEALKSLQREQTQDKTFARELLEQLEILLGLLKKTGGKPGDLLSDYVQRWYSRLPRQLVADVVLEPRATIQLKHVVDLYQTVETFLFDDAVQSLQKKYCDKVPAHLQKKLETRCSDSSLPELTIVQTAIKQFIFRYLRSGFDVNSNQSLSAALASVQLMPGTTDSERNTVTAKIDEEIAISCIREVLAFVENEIQVCEQLGK